jgi:hypothetical protein
MGKEKKNPISVVEQYLVKKHGLFQFEPAFKAISSWFKAHSYEFIEKGHSEKVGSTGRTVESNWVAERKITDYVKFNVKVDVWLRDMTDVAMEKDGKKIKMNRGRIEFIFNADMEKNYADKYGESKFDEHKGTFSNFLKEIYEKYIIKSKLSGFEDKLYNEVVDLADSINAGLEQE